MVKKSLSVLGKQQDAQIMKFNSHPYTLSLQYPVLGFDMSLVVVMHFGAGNALHGIEISMFWFLLNFILYTYPKIYWCCRHKKL